MKDQVLQKIKALSEKAKDAPRPVANKQQSINSLSDNIRTKEQAETFKKLLKAL